MLSQNCWAIAMGAQQVKESTSASTLGAGTSIRASRIKSRVPKDGRLIGSNIFTEHSGESSINNLIFNILCCLLIVSHHLKLILSKIH